MDVPLFFPIPPVMPCTVCARFNVSDFCPRRRSPLIPVDVGRRDLAWTDHGPMEYKSLILLVATWRG